MTSNGRGTPIASPTEEGTAAGEPTERRGMLVAALLFIALVVAVSGSLGAPLITPVAQTYGVSLAAAQWTLTISLLVGAVATPLLGRLGSGPRRCSAVLATLVVVVVGGILTVLPLSGAFGFALLLVGRAAQGVGVGLTALMMGTARDHLGVRGPSTIALLSVTSTAGVGVGYPLAGLLTQIGGVRWAYAFGLVVTAAALVAGLLVLPREDPAGRDTPRVDWLGAVLLSASLVAVLLVACVRELWLSGPWVPVGLLLLAAALLMLWLRWERRLAHPLVDLSVLRIPSVASANLVAFVAAAGLYILFALITRFAQTPGSAGYGLGLTEFEAGLVVTPFSAVAFMTGRIVGRLRDGIRSDLLLAGNGLVVAGACVLFAFARGDLVWPVLAMSLLGAGVGGFWASVPRAILAAVPARETAAVMSANQVLRNMGFALGSALCALVLAAHTAEGARFPDESGVVAAAWWASAVALGAVVAALATGRTSRRTGGGAR